MKLPAFLTKTMRAEIVRDCERLRFIVDQCAEISHGQDGITVWIHNEEGTLFITEKTRDTVAAIDKAMKEWEAHLAYRRQLARYNRQAEKFFKAPKPAIEN